MKTPTQSISVQICPKDFLCFAAQVPQVQIVARIKAGGAKGPKSFFWFQVLQMAKNWLYEAQNRLTED